MKPRAASYTLLLSVAALLAIGLVAIYSVGMTQTKLAGHFQKQLIWAFVGAGAFTIAASVPYETLRRRSFWILGAAVLLLIAVAIPGVGVVHNKARRWLEFGPINFQPSEFAKIAVILALAYYSETYLRQMRSLVHGFLAPGIFILPVLALIAIEPDRGTTALLAAICGVMLIVAGVRWLYVLPAGVLGTAGAVVYALNDKFVMRRIDAWWHLEYYKDDIAYQAWQAMLAFGQGGIFGLGLGNGLQKRGFVPENHTDFILSIIGEEMGLVGALLVVALFVLVVWSGFSIARHSRDHFGMLAAVGLTSLIGIQAAINIGVVTSAFPCKGLALPFISYGGSSLMMMLACVGLLYNLARHAQTSEDPGPTVVDEDDSPFSQAA